MEALDVPRKFESDILCFRFGDFLFGVSANHLLVQSWEIISLGVDRRDEIQPLPVGSRDISFSTPVRNIGNHFLPNRIQVGFPFQLIYFVENHIIILIALRDRFELIEKFMIAVFSRGDHPHDGLEVFHKLPHILTMGLEAAVKVGEVDQHNARQTVALVGHITKPGTHVRREPFLERRNIRDMRIPDRNARPFVENIRVERDFGPRQAVDQRGLADVFPAHDSV